MYLGWLFFCNMFVGNYSMVFQGSANYGVFHLLHLLGMIYLGFIYIQIWTVRQFLLIPHQYSGVPLSNLRRPSFCCWYELPNKQNWIVFSPLILWTKKAKGYNSCIKICEGTKYQNLLTSILPWIMIILISPLFYRLTHIVLIKVAFQFQSVLLQVGFCYCIVQR